MQALMGMNTRGKLILGGCALAFLVAAVLIVRMASSPSYTQVVSGVDPAQTAKVTAALDAQGVAYVVGNGGTQVSVEASKLSQARVAMATAGVSSTGKQPGFELLDHQKLGTSNLQQKVAYQRALEGQVANTIGAIDGVGGAQVSLTMPEQDLFTEDADPATAAVLLQAPAGQLDPNAIRGIANLVANSVEGLKASNVTISDASGSVVWPTGDSSAAGGLSKLSAQQRYDQRTESQLNAMLASTLGANKATAQVTSELNVDETTKESLTYGKQGIPLKEVTESEQLKGGGRPTGGGTAGAASNVATYGQTAAGAAGANSNYRRRDTTRDLALDKTVTKTRVAPGSVQKLSVGLVVDSKLPPAVAQQAQAAVAGAVGLPASGVTLSRMPFATPTTPTPAGGPIPSGIIEPLKTGGLVLAALAFLLFVGRHLRKRESTAFAEDPGWLRELSLPAPVSYLEEPTATYDTAPATAGAPTASAVEELADRDPERVAQQLRGWMAEEAR